MNCEDIQSLFAYNRWANARILEAVSPLAEKDLKMDMSSSHGSVHGTLAHILAAEWIWLMRCNGISPQALPDPNQFPDLNSLRDRWAEVEKQQTSFINELDDRSLSRIVRYTNTIGEQWEYPLSQVLQHVVNHSTYHRGQVVTMLRQLGAAAVMTDLLVFVDSASTKPGETL